MTTTTEEIVISAPKLLPFTDLNKLSCSICGTHGVGPLTRAWMYLTGRIPTIYNVSYCAGGRAPVEDIASPIEAMMRGSSESRPMCGGIEEPHLHLKCRCCDYVRLMRTKTR